jgi:transcriptional regulator with XRE-family HTH domain
MSKSFAQKVDWLFEHRRTEQGRPYTYGQVQRATGNRITASYVWKLRTGAMSNPGLSALEALADFFEVPLSYFGEGGEYLEPSVGFLKTIPDKTVRRDDALALVTEGTSKLPDDKLRAVIDVVEYFQHR